MKFFICFLLIFTHYLTGLEWTRQDVNRSSEHAGRLSTKVSRHLEKKYGLYCCGAGLSMPGGPIRSILLSFSIKGPQSFSNARRIMVNCIKDMLFMVKNDTSIQSYLYDPPFNLKNVDLIIYIKDSNGRTVMSPDISVVSFVDETILYCYSDPEKIVYPYLKVVEETYEEALEAIRQEDALVDGG